MIAAGVGLLVLGAVLYFSSKKKPTKKKPKAVKNKRDTPKAPIKKPTEHKNTTKNVVQKPKTVAKKPAAAKKHAAVVVAKKPAAAAPVVAKKPAAIAPKPAVVKKEEPKKVEPKPASEPTNPKPAATIVPEKAPVPEKATTPKPKPAPKKQAETKVIAAPKVEEAVKPVAKEPEAPQPKPAAVASELATPPKRVEPKTGTLKIMNIRGKTLVNKDNVGQGDPYFIIKLGKQTFKTQRQSGANPTFTERFNLNVREPYATVHLSGMEWDRFTTHDLIGSSSPNVDIFRQSKSQTTHSFDLYKKGKKGSQGTMVFDCVWEPDHN